MAGMETCSPTHPAIDLSTELYYQLVYTLTDLLPPPLDDTPEALHVRIRAAIAKVAALLPVNANEADLAAQCIAARAQAEEMLRLIRQHANDIGLGDTAERAVRIDGADLSFRARAPDAGAGVAPEAREDRRRGERGRVDAACRRTVDAGGSGSGCRTAGGGVAQSGPGSRHRSRRRRLPWTRGLRTMSQNLGRILRTRLLRRWLSEQP